MISSEFASVSDPAVAGLLVVASLGVALSEVALVGVLRWTGGRWSDIRATAIEARAQKRSRVAPGLIVAVCHLLPAVLALSVSVLSALLLWLWDYRVAAPVCYVVLALLVALFGFLHWRSRSYAFRRRSFLSAVCWAWIGTAAAASVFVSYYYVRTEFAIFAFGVFASAWPTMHAYFRAEMNHVQSTQYMLLVTPTPHSEGRTDLDSDPDLGNSTHTHLRASDNITASTSSTSAIDSVRSWSSGSAICCYVLSAGALCLMVAIEYLALRSLTLVSAAVCCHLFDVLGALAVLASGEATPVQSSLVILLARGALLLGFAAPSLYSHTVIFFALAMWLGRAWLNSWYPQSRLLLHRPFHSVDAELEQRAARLSPLAFIGQKRQDARAVTGLDESLDLAPPSSSSLSIAALWILTLAFVGDVAYTAYSRRRDSSWTIGETLASTELAFALAALLLVAVVGAISIARRDYCNSGMTITKLVTVCVAVAYAPFVAAGVAVLQFTDDSTPTRLLFASVVLVVPLLVTHFGHLVAQWKLLDYRWLVPRHYTEQVTRDERLSDKDRTAMIRAVRRQDFAIIGSVMLWCSELLVLSTLVSIALDSQWWIGGCLALATVTVAATVIAFHQYFATYTLSRTLGAWLGVAALGLLGAGALVFAFGIGPDMDSESFLLLCILFAYPCGALLCLGLYAVYESGGVVSAVAAWSLVASASLLVLFFFTVSVIYPPWFIGAAGLSVALATTAAVASLAASRKHRHTVIRTAKCFIATVVLVAPVTLAVIAKNALIAITAGCFVAVLVLLGFALGQLGERRSFHASAHASHFVLLAPTILPAFSFDHARASKDAKLAYSSLRSLESGVVCIAISLLVVHCWAVLTPAFADADLACAALGVDAFVASFGFFAANCAWFHSWRARRNAQRQLAYLERAHPECAPQIRADSKREASELIDAIRGAQRTDSNTPVTAVNGDDALRVASRLRTALSRSSRVHPVTDAAGSPLTDAEAATLQLAYHQWARVDAECTSLFPLLATACLRKRFEALHHARLVSMLAMSRQNGRQDFTLHFLRSLSLASTAFLELLGRTLAWESDRAALLARDREIRAKRDEAKAARAAALQLRARLEAEAKEVDHMQRIQQRRAVMDAEKQRQADEDSEEEQRVLAELKRLKAEHQLALEQLEVECEQRDGELEDMEREAAAADALDDTARLRAARIQAKRAEQLRFLAQRKKQESDIIHPPRMGTHTSMTEADATAPSSYDQLAHLPVASVARFGSASARPKSSSRPSAADSLRSRRSELKAARSRQAAKLHADLEARRSQSLQARESAWHTLKAAMAASNCCSLKLTGTSLVPQQLFECVTCRTDGLCLTCKERCHAGHKTRVRGIQSAYCECGLQPCGAIKSSGSGGTGAGKRSHVVSESGILVEPVSAAAPLAVRSASAATSGPVPVSSRAASALEDSINAIVAELDARGDAHFIDAAFPHCDRSLFIDESSPHRDDWSRCQWKRVHEVLQQPQLFAPPFSADDVEQGQIGNCWFISALAVLTLREEAVYACFHALPAAVQAYGIYAVRFFRNNEIVHVIVDDSIPVRRDDNDDTKPRFSPLFAHSRSGAELWSLLIEKAFAKLNGCYEAIEGGWVDDALVHLTGGSSERLAFGDPAVQAALMDGRLWQQILEATKAGFLLGCGSPVGRSDNEADASADGIIQSHAYSVLGAVEADGVNLIHLRNPWGRAEWQGAYSDHSPLWTDKLKALCCFEAKDDGAFWMDFHDFTVNFDELYVCKFFEPHRWPCRGQLASEWRGHTAGGCVNHETVGSNPQFAIRDASDSNGDISIHLELRQADRRVAADGSASNSYPIIILEVYDNSGQRVTRSVRGSMVVSKGAGASEVSVEFKLRTEAGSRPRVLTVLPCTYEPQVETSFTLRWFATHPVHVQAFSQAGALQETHVESVKQLAWTEEAQPLQPAVIKGAVADGGETEAPLSHRGTSTTKASHADGAESIEIEFEL